MEEAETAKAFVEFLMGKTGGNGVLNGRSLWVLSRSCKGFMGICTWADRLTPEGIRETTSGPAQESVSSVRSAQEEGGCIEVGKDAQQEDEALQAPSSPLRGREQEPWANVEQTWRDHLGSCLFLGSRGLICACGLGVRLVWGLGFQIPTSVSCIVS